MGKEDYLLAMEHSPVCDTKIKTLIRAALTDAVDNRKVYMRGVDASYRYEGYVAYSMSDLG